MKSISILVSVIVVAIALSKPTIASNLTTSIAVNDSDIVGTTTIQHNHNNRHHGPSGHHGGC